MTIRRKIRPQRPETLRVPLPHPSWSRSPQMQAGGTIQPADFWARLGL